MAQVQSEFSKILFTELNLPETLLQALNEKNYVSLTTVQAKTLPLALAHRDILASAKTGTGKTLCFLLPIISKLSQQKVESPGVGARALILAPTRELALQIKQNCVELSAHTSLKTLAVYGGTPLKNQVKFLESGVDILVATPGRLLDILQQNKLSLKQVKNLVFDEVDRMLDLGFKSDLEKIISVLPQKRQTMMFSATLPPLAHEMAKVLLTHPENIFVNDHHETPEAIEQKVFLIETAHKKDLLKKILKSSDNQKVLIFVNSIESANKLALTMTNNHFPCEVIHRNKTQAVRNKLVSSFSSGEIKYLICTDLLSRGLDILNTTHVINYDLPNTPEIYIHRIGRTGRISDGLSQNGIALSFCDKTDLEKLKKIEDFLKTKLMVEKNQPYHSIKIEQMRLK